MYRMWLEIIISRLVAIYNYYMIIVGFDCEVLASPSEEFNLSSLLSMHNGIALDKTASDKSAED